MAPNVDYPQVVLRHGRDFSVRKGHPWVFSGAIGKLPQGLVDGDIVTVFSSEKDCLGVAHFATGGSIALKMLSRAPVPIEKDFFVGRIHQARQLRLNFELPREGRTTAFRLIHGEGDGLPGLIVDIYNDVAVFQAQSTGMIRAKESIAEALCEVFRNSLVAVVDKSDKGEYLWGEGGNPKILEHELLFEVDWLQGQKTGFFLDQRENRRYVRSLSRGKRVLNAFCYSGGFSLAALAGGAASVTSLDSSEKALALLERNLLLNREAGMVSPDTPHESICDDFLRFMQAEKKEFDLVILDPPAFAKHRKALESGLRGYKSINTAGLRLLAEGGMLLTFSCSQLVTRDGFRELLQECASKVGKELRIFKEFHQAPCHPVSIFHPEGEYLKGFGLVSV